MPEKRDYYEVLGVDKSSDESQIKKAYWKLAKKYHPDVNPNDKVAEEKFKEANEAYQVLSDPEKKARYDQFGHSGVDGQGGFGGAGFGGAGFDLNDLFNSLFGGGGFGFGGRSQSYRGPSPGANLRYRMSLSFMEAAFGTKREIKIRKEDLCDTCHGKGTSDGSEPSTCSVCHGSGQVNVRQQTLFGQMMTSAPCQQCQGRGTVVKNPCNDCHGSGRRDKTKRLEVQIPAGINHGEMLTLRGEGEPGQKGGPYGDLYIEIQIKPHDVFKRQGNTTYCELPITYAQAVLGLEIDVPTIDGNVKYQLKEGTQPNEVFTIRGKGIPYIKRNNLRGDHKFSVVLEVPYSLNDQQKKMLKNFDDSITEQHYKKRKSFFEKLKGIFS